MNTQITYQGQNNPHALVQNLNNEAVTTSRQVAATFDKEHKHVLRDIITLKKDVPNFGLMFKEGTAPDSYGRQQPIYYINRDGFTLLAMGFTGSKALQFKLAYIQAFNEMEQALKQPKQLTAREQMQLVMSVAEETAERVDELETTVQVLANEITINNSQQKQLQAIVNKKVLDAVGGKGSPAYKELGRKVYAAAWRELKNHFFVPRYQEVKKVDFEEAVKLLSMFEPSASLQLDIEKVNNGGV